MEKNQLPCVPQPDRARFEQIWRRVMPQDRPDCPFTLYGGDDTRRLMPCDGSLPTRDEPAEPSMELGLGRAVPMDVPTPGALLQDMIADEICDWRTYQNMAQRMAGSAKRVLTGIAADEQRHAKRLSVAYFLLSGVHFWPGRLPGIPSSTFLGGMRRQFLGEQEGERAYRAAAAAADDPGLTALFLDLADDEAIHAGLLRGILEQM